MEKKEEILTYKLVGVLNLFDVIPECVYPVFENKFNNNKKLFIQHKGDPIASFDFLVNKNMLENVKSLKSFDLVSPKVENNEFKVGDSAIIGYQFDEKHLFLGTIKDALKYAEETNDQTMKERIDVLLEFYGLENSNHIL